MATELVKVEGILEWAKIFEVNRDYRYSEETDGEYQITVIMDGDNTKKLKEAGCAKTFKKDEQGRGTVVRLTRPHNTGKDWQGGPPKVAGPDGTAWDLQADGLIGNGSRGVVVVSIYGGEDGLRKGSRLEAVQVIDHIRYESENNGNYGGYESFFKDYTKGEDPKKSAPVKSAPVKREHVELNDEIPF